MKREMTFEEEVEVQKAHGVLLGAATVAGLAAAGIPGVRKAIGFTAGAITLIATAGFVGYGVYCLFRSGVRVAKSRKHATPADVAEAKATATATLAHA